LNGATRRFDIPKATLKKQEHGKNTHAVEGKKLPTVFVTFQKILKKKSPACGEMKHSSSGVTTNKLRRLKRIQTSHVFNIK
jgi:hypothetical protein